MSLADRIEIEVRYSMVPEWVLDHEKAGLSANAVRLYAVLARYGNSEGGGVYPSRRTLASRMGVKKLETVDAARRELERVGAIEVKSGKSAGASNTYMLAFAPTPFSGVPPSTGYLDERGTGGTTFNGVQQREGLTENVSPDGETSGTGESVPDLVGHFIDEAKRVVGREPRPGMPGRMGKHVKKLRKDGADDDLIRAAITELVEQGREVGAIFTIADQLHRGGYRGPKRQTAGMTAREIAEMQL